MIYRDGANISLWQATTPESTTNSHPETLSSTADLFDVIIVGGGITGVTTALLLQEQGLNCVILEAETLCFGTTGGTTAHLNTILDTPYTTLISHFGEDHTRQVADAAKKAIALIERNISTYHIDAGYEVMPAYLFAQDDAQKKELDDIFKGCQTVGVSVEYVDEMPLSMPAQKIMAVPGQARFHPTRYVQGLAKAFQSLGGEIIEHCRVKDVDNNETITAHTSKGDVKGNVLVYATHIPPGINILDTRCAPYRTYAMVVELSDNYPTGLFYDMQDPYHYYRTQDIDGKSYFIAGGEDHKTGHEENTDVCFRRLESHIRQHFAVDKIAYQWSSQYFEPVDGLPYIGHLPGAPGNILVATGYGGNGMIYSSVAAMTLKEIIQKEPAQYASLFDPNRLKPVAGFENFVKENFDVARKWFGKLLPADKLSSLSDLAREEGRIVKFEGETIAIYKDQAGNVHALAPTCPHMGCHVAWNAAEKSWDCPCHGARYSIDGTVITGPATSDLHRINVEKLV